MTKLNFFILFVSFVIGMSIGILDNQKKPLKTDHPVICDVLSKSNTGCKK